LPAYCGSVVFVVLVLVFVLLTPVGLAGSGATVVVVAVVEAFGSVVVVTAVEALAVVSTGADASGVETVVVVAGAPGTAALVVWVVVVDWASAAAGSRPAAAIIMNLRIGSLLMNSFPLPTLM